MRHIEHAMPVLGIGIVAGARELSTRRAAGHCSNVVVIIQWKARRDVGVEVRFPDLIVPQDAVGIANASTPTLRQAFRPLDHGCVIPADPLGYLARIDVQKLWIRTEELSAGERSTRTKAAACQLWPSEEWIRHLLRQRRTEREIFRIDLVDIYRSVLGSAESEMIASCSNVANADRHIAWELLLDISRILLYSWSLSILIHETDGCPNAAQGAQAVAGWMDDANREWVIERHGWNWRALRDYGVLSVAHLSVIVVGCVGNRIVVRRPKHSVTAANDSARSKRIGEAGARRPLYRRRVALGGLIIANTSIHEAAADLPGGRARDGIGRNRHIAQTARCFRIETHREVVVLFAQAIFMLRT